jgi:thiamine-monophosphate kinase
MRTDEFSLIDLFVKQFEKTVAPFGPGDDCAVIPPSKYATCVTTDSLVENVHFTRKHFSFEDIGHKALAVNLSDLAAMGAKPQWMLCALQLPSSTTPNQVKQMAQGMSALAKIHHIKLVGGNISKGNALSITITASGIAKHPVLRSGAQAGDQLYVSGLLGRAAAGFHLTASAKAKKYPSLLLAQKRPAPHVALMELIAPFLSSAIDVSDGLLQDLSHVLKASKAGADLFQEMIPVCPEVKSAFPSRALKLALGGGEDYVVLFSVKKNRQREFKMCITKNNVNAYNIGSIVTKSGCRMDGKPVSALAGFAHF